MERASTEAGVGSGAKSGERGVEGGSCWALSNVAVVCIVVSMVTEGGHKCHEVLAGGGGGGAFCPVCLLLPLSSPVDFPLLTLCCSTLSGVGERLL